MTVTNVDMACSVRAATWFSVMIRFLLNCPNYIDILLMWIASRSHIKVAVYIHPRISMLGQSFYEGQMSSMPVSQIS